MSFRRLLNWLPIGLNIWWRHLSRSKLNLPRIRASQQGHRNQSTNRSKTKASIWLRPSSIRWEVNRLLKISWKEGFLKWRIRPWERGRTRAALWQALYTKVVWSDSQLTILMYLIMALWSNLRWLICKEPLWPTMEWWNLLIKWWVILPCMVWQIEIRCRDQLTLVQNRKWPWCRN